MVYPAQFVIYDIGDVLIIMVCAFCLQWLGGKKASSLKNSVGILECDLTGALLVLEFQLSPLTLIACLCSKIRDGLTLVYRLTCVILETGR